jgi:hypothetical protein
LIRLFSFSFHVHLSCYVGCTLLTLSNHLRFRFFPLSSLSQRCLADAIACKSMTGLKISDFELLWVLTQDHLAGTTQRGTERKRARSDEPAIPDRVVLFMTLYWLRAYPTEAQLGAVFGFHQRSVMREVWRCVEALDVALYDQIPSIHEWTADEWRELVDEQRQFISKAQRAQFLRDGNVCIVVDGSEFRIGRPDAENQHSRYSFKKHQHALNVLFVVTLQGRILWVSDPYDDVPNDQGQWKMTKFRESTCWWLLVRTLCQWFLLSVVSGW